MKINRFRLPDLIVLVAALLTAACVDTSGSAPTVAVKADSAATDASAEVGAADAVLSETAPDAGLSGDATVSVDAASDVTADSVGDQGFVDSPDAEQVDATPETTLDAAVDLDAQATDGASADAQNETLGDAVAVDSLDGGGDSGIDAGTEPPKPGLAAPCDSDEDCNGSGAGKKCHIGSHSCVICLGSKDCVAGELCQANVCTLSKVCKSDTDCKATNQVCDKAEAVCADCAADVDCGTGKCADHKCVAVTACKTSKECPAVCDQVKGICAQCAANNDCKDGNFCAAGACVPKLCLAPLCAGGKAFACKGDGSGYDTGKSCDDSNLCTEGDACEAGACKPGPAKICDDKNPCTTDSCDAKLGCQTANNSAACDDKNPCTEVDACANGSCAGKAKNCDDAKTCTSDACKDGTCVSLAQPGTCTDGTACTDGDVCAAGNCSAGKPVSCDDNNVCTIDSCAPANGCVWVIKTGACDDGNNCTQNDLCTAGKCAGTGKQCDDGNACTDDKCDAGQCSFAANTKACDDKDACTDTDLCANGKCTSKPKVCDDGNPCTDNHCMSTGCAFQVNTKTCDDGDGCTVSDTCTSAKCGGSPKPCDDGNPCTDDACTAGACAFVANAAPCGDVGACSVCSAGKCVGDTTKGFEDTFGGTKQDSFRGAIAVTGGWLFYGTTASKGAGGDDGWVVKTDATGSVQWEKTYGSAYNDAFRHGVVGNDGNYVFTGFTYVSGSSTQLWLLKIDGAGAVIWNKTFGSTAEEYGWGLAAIASGYLIAGQYKYTGSSSVTQYGWVIQVDEQASQTWEKQLPGTNYAEAVAGSADGNLYVVCQGYGPQNSVDILVKKLKPGGSQVWSTAIGSTTGSDMPTDMVVVGDGQLFVAGRHYFSTGDRAVLAKLDGNGTVAWTKTYGDAYTEAYGMAAVGTSIVLAGRGYFANSQYDGYLVRAAQADGALIWQHKIPFVGNYTDELYGVAAAPGGLVAVGMAYVGNGADYDAWLLRLNDKGQLACGCSGATCDDGNPCTVDACYLGICKGKQVAATTLCKTETSAVGKCDAAGVCISLCGNKYCDNGENNSNCPGDCITACGNGICESGENYSNCSKDCKHVCDSSCGGKAPSGCYCDTTCKTEGDCCTGTGYAGTNKTYSCAGSTCTSCK